MFRTFARLLIALLPAVFLQAQTQFVRDTFTGGSGAFLESHAPDSGGAWTRIQGQGLILQSGEVTPDKTISTDRYTNTAVPPAAEYVIGMRVSFISTNPDNYVELLGRMTGLHGYYAYVNAQSQYQIIRRDAGGSTVLASGTTSALAIGLAFDNEIVFYVTDAAKRLIINGTVVATTTDNTITAAGRVGFGLQVKTKADSFGDNFFSSTLAPTAVTMDAMRATSDGTRTLLTWTPGRTSHNLGYRIWRDASGARECITPFPIAGSAFFANAAEMNAGTTYRWIDDATASAYWIEEIDLRGTREWHGPITPSAGRIDEGTVRTPKLSEVAQRSAVTRVVHDVLQMRSNATEGAAFNFELAAREAQKISIVTPGIYEVPIPAGAVRDRLRLWEDGREVPILLTANTIRFYGTPLDTPASGTRVYWLSWDDGTRGARMTSNAMTSAPLHEVSGFTATIELRDKSLFAPTLQSEDGDGFFGPVITNDASAPARQVLRLAAIDRSAATAELGLTVQGATHSAHRIDVTVNGHAAATVTFEGQAKAQATLAIDAAWLRDGDNEIVLVAQNGADDVSAIEAVRIAYSRKYALTDNSLLFTAPGGTRVPIEGLTGSSIALDISNPAAPVQLATSGDIVDVAGSGTRLVFVSSRPLAPARIEANEPSSLHTTQAGAFVIVAPRAFLSALAPLASRRTDAVLAAIEDIYDEFSFGAKDPAAIRAFANATRPRAVLLAGDGTYDPRDYVGGGAADVIPVKLVETALQRVPSDAWFTDFDDDGVADIAIGRLPARTPAELQSMVAKIIAYESDAAPAGDVVFVSGSGAFDAQRSSQTTKHIDVEVEGVVAARQNLLQQWSAGAAIIDYMGHGSVEMWETASFFSRTDAASIGDGASLPLVIAMTCLNGYFHDIAQESLAEALLHNTNGGAAAVWALSTLTEASGQAPANEALLRSLSNAKTFGEATMNAQRATSDADVRRTLLLFGDPTMQLRGARAPVRRRAVR